MDLRANAIITAVDRFSGPVGGMASALSRLRGQAGQFTRDAGQAYQRVASTASRAMNAVTNPLPSVTSLLDKAEDFNRHMYGVGAAVLTDHAKRIKDQATGMEAVLYDTEKVKEVMRGAEEMSLDMAKTLGHTPSRISGIAEVLAKAGFSAEKLEGATRAVAILSSTDLDTPVQRIAEFADVLQTIYKPKEGEKWGEFFARQLDLVRVAAAETRLSVGSMMEGLRPFSALYSLLGGDETKNAVMLMSAVKKGAEASEGGQTLKSNAANFIVMSQEAASMFAAAGFKRSDYTDTSQLDPMRAVGNLSRMFRAANIKGAYRAELEASIQKAIESGTFDTPEFMGQLMDNVSKRAGADMNDELSRARFEEKFAMAIQGAGMRADMYKLYNDMVEKGYTPSLLQTLFNKRRVGTNVQLLEGLRDFRQEYENKLGTASPAGLAAAQDVYSESAYGRLQRFKSLIEQFQIKLANSDGFEKLLNGLTKFVDLAGQAAEKIGAITGKLKIFDDDREHNKQTYDASPALRETADAMKDKPSVWQWLARKWDELAAPPPKPVEISPSRAAEMWIRWGGMQPPPSPAGVSSRAVGAGTADMVRMMYPEAGPRTIDVTGKVDANVQGTVEGRMQLEATIKVEGGGQVINQRTSGGDVKGALNTGATMTDTKAAK